MFSVDGSDTIRDVFIIYINCRRTCCTDRVQGWIGESWRQVVVARRDRPWSRPVDSNATAIIRERTDDGGLAESNPLETKWLDRIEAALADALADEGLLIEQTKTDYGHLYAAKSYRLYIQETRLGIWLITPTVGRLSTRIS